MPPNRLEVILSGNVRPLADAFLEAAARADDMGDRMRGAFGKGAEAAAALAQQMGNSGGPFNPEQFEAAETSLNKLGALSEANLQKVGDAAAATGEPLEGLAEAFGRFEKFGDAKSVLAFQKAIGASVPDLEKYGAAVDKNGKLLLETDRQVRAAHEAVQQFMDANFAGAMERMADPASKLAGQTNLLKQELGKASFELRDSFAPALLNVVESLRGMPEPMKAALGLTVDFAAHAGPAAAGAIQMAAGLKSLGLSLTGILGGVKTLGGLLIGYPGLLLAAAAAFQVTTAEMQKANKAAEDLLAIEEKRAATLRNNKDLIGAGAEEWKKQGKTAKDVADTIASLHDQAEEARKRGDAGAVESVNLKIAHLQQVKAAMAEEVQAHAAAETAKKQATDKALEAQEHRVADYKEKAAASFWGTAAEHLKALDAVLAGETKGSKVYEELSLQRIKLARQAATEVTKANEEGRKKDLELALAQANKVGVASKEGELKALREILAAKQLTAEEKVKIETQAAQLEVAITKEATEKKKKAEQERVKQLEETHKLAAQLASAEAGNADATISALQAKLDKGEDVLEQLTQEINKRTQLQQKAIEEKAEADKVGKSPKDKAAIDKAAHEEVAATRTKGELDVQATTDKAAKAREALAVKELEIAERTVDVKLNGLARELAAGKNVGNQLATTARERLALQEQMLTLKAKEEQVGKSLAEQALIQKKLELDLQDARTGTAQQLQAILDQGNSDSGGGGGDSSGFGGGGQDFFGEGGGGAGSIGGFGKGFGKSSLSFGGGNGAIVGLLREISTKMDKSHRVEINATRGTGDADWHLKPNRAGGL